MEYKNNENYQEQLNDLMSQLRMSLSNYKKSFVQYKVYGTSEQEQIYNNDKNNVRLTLNKYRYKTPSILKLSSPACSWYVNCIRIPLQ